MKAILVIDIPTSDIENYFMRYELNYMKCGTGKYVSYVKLKPMPERKKELSIEETIVEHRLPNNKYATSIQLEKAIKKAKQRGYNTCIDEILGEK